MIAVRPANRSLTIPPSLGAFSQATYRRLHDAPGPLCSYTPDGRKQI
jgi:hypothetical protein